MRVIDSQVHIGTASDMTADELIVMMDAACVDTIILDEFHGYSSDGHLEISEPLSGGGRRYMNPLSVDAQVRFPGRFKHIGRIHRLDPDIPARVEQLRAEGCVAIRLLVTAVTGELERFAAGYYDDYFAILDELRMPLFMYNSWGYGENLLVPYLERHPDMNILFDHLGLSISTHAEFRTGDYREIRGLLDLGARFQNLHIKISHGALLSSEPYPFRDWQAAARGILDVFGAERALWATDITFENHIVNGAAFWDPSSVTEVGRGRRRSGYAQQLYCLLDSDLFTDGEKSAIFGLTAQRFLQV